MGRKAIGKGLEALIQDKTDEIVYIPINKIKSNPYQPRKEPDEKVEEIAESIKEHGIINPIRVAKRGDDFVLVAGERRLLGAKKANLKKIPCILINVTDKEMLEIALVENLQREDLDPVEEAEAYYLLATEFKLTHEQIAKIVGKDRTTITNTLRLLKLPLYVREELRKGNLTQGHARVLITLKDQYEMEKIAKIAIKENWTVRKIEKYIYKKNNKKTTKEEPLYIQAVKQELEKALDTKVEIKGENRGKLIIHFYNQNELERITTIILMKNGKF